MPTAPPHTAALGPGPVLGLRRGVRGLLVLRQPDRPCPGGKGREGVSWWGSHTVCLPFFFLNIRPPIHQHASKRRHQGGISCFCMKQTQSHSRYCASCRKSIPGLDHHCLWCVRSRLAWIAWPTVLVAMLSVLPSPLPRHHHSGSTRASARATISSSSRSPSPVRRQTVATWGVPPSAPRNRTPRGSPATNQPTNQPSAPHGRTTAWQCPGTLQFALQTAVSVLLLIHAGPSVQRAIKATVGDKRAYNVGGAFCLAMGGWMERTLLLDDWIGRESTTATHPP